MKPRKMYINQKSHAKKRGIDFYLTYDEWITIWLESGKFAERGRGKGKYVMARLGDRGPYAVGNVKIILNEDNSSEGNLGKIVSQETKQKIATAHKGKTFSDETRQRMSASAKVKVFTEKQKEAFHRSRAGKNNTFYGKKHTEETKAKLRQAALRQHGVLK